MEILSNIFYFIIVIIILVVIHEWGHFIAARITGMRADIFALGMGRRLFGWNKNLGFTFGPLPDNYEFDGKTDWRVCLFPIGGYVKIPGMVDETIDDSFDNNEVKDYEFRSKNTFQKALVLSAGVIMNFILAVLIFASIKWVQGEYRTNTTEIAYVYQNSLANNIGLETGDVVKKINGKRINSWEELMMGLSLDNFGDNLKIEVLRNNNSTILSIDKNFITNILTDNSKMESGFNKAIGLDPSNCYVLISELVKNEPASRAGFKQNDTILSINSNIVSSSGQMVELINNSHGTLAVKLKRGERILNTFVTPNPESNKIGVYSKTIYTGEKTKIDYSLWKSISYGYSQSIDLINLIVTSFSEIFSGNIEFSSAVGGPIMIAKQSAKTAEMGFVSFLVFIANLSISLALINILPIPALDGGHLIVVLIEGIIRRELSTKVKIVIQNIGMAILFIFLIFVIYQDIMR